MGSAWAAENRLVLAQVAVNEKSNEITAIPELLKLLVLEGCIVTIDAMGTQRAIAAQIIEQKGDYAWRSKRIKGTCMRMSKIALPWRKKIIFGTSSINSMRTIDKDHGRLEIREHWIIDDREQLTYLDQEGK